MGLYGDIAIREDCNLNNESFCYYSSEGTFSQPQGKLPASAESRAYLAGSFKFRVSEIEVF